MQATNGALNGLLRNEGGKLFTNVAAELGLEGTSWSYASAAADYDGDGKADLAVANLGSDNVSVLLGNGNGTFQAVVNHRVGEGPRSGEGNNAKLMVGQSQGGLVLADRLNGDRHIAQ